MENVTRMPFSGTACSMYKKRRLYMSNAYKTGNYTNLFGLIGKTEADVSARIEQIWQTFFYGSEEERIYHPAEPDMGYLEDTGNHDARTEGMSYGMMMAVQTGHKEEFDRIWKWAYTNMWHLEECYDQGYFAWSCALDGRHNSEGAAPDGEEYFAMSLFFASNRWGDGEGVYAYSKHARTILRAMVHNGETREGAPMFNRENKQILFVPGIDFTDPSYHLPHFYELFALWADEEDRSFFKEAAKVSREYLTKACHPVTGMSPEYGEFDGRPMSREGAAPWIHERHDMFYSDSYRTAANIGLDYEWFATDLGQCGANLKLVRFLDNLGDDFAGIFEVDGTRAEGKALHPVGLKITTTEGLLAVVGPYLNQCGGDLAKVKDVMPKNEYELCIRWLTDAWNTPLREGDRRYYDNCLYFFAFLALSGNYRIL